MQNTHPTDHSFICSGGKFFPAAVTSGFRCAETTGVWNKSNQPGFLNFALWAIWNCHLFLRSFTQIVPGLEKYITSECGCNYVLETPLYGPLNSDLNRHKLFRIFRENAKGFCMCSLVNANCNVECLILVTPSPKVDRESEISVCR